MEAVESDDGYSPVVRLACLDDDAQGEALEVVWDLELGSEILDADSWKAIGQKGLDQPRQFAAYIHTLRWNCVTATDPRLFQAPFRAGILGPAVGDNARRPAYLRCVGLFRDFPVHHATSRLTQLWSKPDVSTTSSAPH
ncbi:MAG: hypothetical protein ACHQ9S_18205 [Candidatus Binatia bacterium]